MQKEPLFYRYFTCGGNYVYGNNNHVNLIEPKGKVILPGAAHLVAGRDDTGDILQSFVLTGECDQNFPL